MKKIRLTSNRSSGKIKDKRQIIQKEGNRDKQKKSGGRILQNELTVCQVIV